MEEFFKTPTQEEIDRQWLTQLCYDGQMADDEIEEFVDAVIQWKDKAVQCALLDVVGQGEQLACSRCNENEKQEANDPYCIECKIEIERQAN